MRLKLLLVVAAAMVGTSSAFFEVETASLVPLLTQIPYVEEILGLFEQLGLPNPLEKLPEKLFTKKQILGKLGYGLAATGVGIIEIASFIGYIFNYLDKIEKVNFEQREAAEAMKEAMEAAAEAEGGEGDAEVAEGSERFYSILPYSGPTLPGSIKARLANRRKATGHPQATRRVDSQHARRPVRRPLQPIIPNQRRYPSRMHKQRLLMNRRAQTPITDAEVMGRAATVVTPEGGGGVMGLLAQTGNLVLELVKRFFLKDVQAGSVGREMKDLLEEAADTLTEELMQQLDPDGCLQKLLCHLQERPSISLTPEEGVLATVFPLRWPHARCAADHFQQCVLSVEQLEALLPPAPSRNTNAIP
ncbi:uncharacterized protein LOC127005202 [Eriocheir sinensis]|uniref:uncharacterized protein LOC127005202 n=1 Tax=Eriocheir sinensis TaxID=95602 RepID=UPI0021C7C12B|nr:uncharacterized protein LOC127005202 [Eriocheir sinensis]